MATNQYFTWFDVTIKRFNDVKVSISKTDIEFHYEQEFKTVESAKDFFFVSSEFFSNQ